MLVTIPQLDAGQERGAPTRFERIVLRGVQSTVERAMIRDIHGVEAGARVPLTISLGVESASSIVRSRGVAVKVNRDEVRIAQL